jgi:hypothetical protein
MLTDSSAGTLAGPTDPAGLVLERLPSGEFGWLRPETPGYVLTDAGRRALALAWLFGPTPTLAEACAEAETRVAA